MVLKPKSHNDNPLLKVLQTCPISLRAKPTLYNGLHGPTSCGISQDSFSTPALTRATAAHRPPGFSFNTPGMPLLWACNITRGLSRFTSTFRLTRLAYISWHQNHLESHRPGVSLPARQPQAFPVWGRSSHCLCSVLRYCPGARLPPRHSSLDCLRCKEERATAGEFCIYWA